MEIRRIEKEDNSAIAAIIREVMTEFGASGEGFSIHDPEVDEMWENYSTPGAQYFVIEDNNKIVGGAGVAALEGGETSVCELKKMYFLPEARGKGLGKIIMSKCIQAARELNYSLIYIETVPQMEMANKLYIKSGFQRIDGPMGATGHFGCTHFYTLNLQSVEA